MRTRRTHLAAGIGGLLAVLASVAVGSSGALASDSQEDRDNRAMKAALGLASRNGDNAPAAAEIFYSSRAEASGWLAGAATDDSDGGRQVAVTILRGNFTGFMASVPSGRPLPTGTTLIVVTDRDSGEVTDWNLRNGTQPNPPAPSHPVNPRQPA